MRKHIVIPDCQVKPGVPVDHLEWAGRYIAEKKPDVVVQIGDFADMESLSSYDTGKKCFEGRRYKKDVVAVQMALSVLQRGLGKFNPRRKVLTLGNHEDRITRAIESDPKLDGTIGIEDLGYKEAGWEVHPFLSPVKIDGVTYCHYFPVPNSPRKTAISDPKRILTTYHVTAIAGHQQGRKSAGPLPLGYDGRTIQAIISGSFYMHKEQYLPPIDRRHWNGIVVLNEVRRGMFDEMFVSLDYLRRKYGKKRKVKPKTRRS